MKHIKVDYKRVPNCLRKFRKTNGYSQKQVAVMLGVRNTGMISRWERGCRFPRPLNIFRLAVIYRTMVDALYIDLIRDLRKDIQKRREKLEAKQEATGKASGK
jgi:transcriptional regulator with XRE-family HTH domain